MKRRKQDGTMPIEWVPSEVRARMEGRKLEVGNALKAHAVWDLWRTMPDGPEKYQAYLCSPDWGKLRAIVTERSGGKCERCKANDAAAVHHLTYQRKYQELPEDLIHYCQGCHDYTHGKSEVDPITQAFKDIPTRPLSESLTVSDTWGEEKDCVCCPFCGDNYSHIGTIVDDPHGANQGKVTISMWGECGHAWDIVIFGHKGNAFAEVGNVRADDHV